MKSISVAKIFLGLVAGAALLFGLGACANNTSEELPTAELGVETEAPFYRIGPGDNVEIFVWRNPDLSRAVAVRPDGRITVPLVEDLYVTGKTPSELARLIEKELGVYIQDPLVTVMVAGFRGPFDQQIRVTGEAQSPAAIPYQADMTLLDVMITVGGITDFADGDNSTLVRVSDGQMQEFRVRIDSLVRDGDISANIAMLPGDVLIIPETYY